MPEKKTLERARRAKREGKKPTTQAGAFVGEEMRHAKRGKHPVKSREQAIAIGLSKARRAGVKVPKKGAASSSRKKTSSKKATSRKKSSSRKTSKKR